MSHGVPDATFLMRWWKKGHSKLVDIATILARGLELEAEDIKLLREIFLEWRAERPSKVELSVYACAQQDARDPGHALGVVAVTLPLLLGKSDSEHSRTVRKRSGATMLIERAALEAVGFTPQHTPASCHTLCVAAPYHWDLCAEGEQVGQLYDFFCEQLKDATRLYKIDPDAKSSSTEQPFRDQATIALKVCCDVPWLLSEEGACEGEWSQAGDLCAQDQINALRRLAKAIQYPWRH